MAAKNQFIDMFLYGSSEVDWCEQNFVVTGFIAEFWNTVSNVLFLVIPPILMFISSAYWKEVSKGLHTLLTILVIVGFGSIYFHGMLSFVGQLLDEIAILWVIMCGIAFYFPKLAVRKIFRQSRQNFAPRMLFLMVVLTVLSFCYPKINHVLLFLFAVPCVFMVCYEHRRSTDKRALQLGFSCLLLFFLAAGCWVIDRILCDYCLRVGFPYFHSIWHVLVSLSGYQVVILMVYYDSLREFPELFPVIKYWPDDSQKIFGLYYISFIYHTPVAEDVV